jgi:hypothetical protein
MQRLILTLDESAEIMYVIEYAKGAVKDFAKLRTYDLQQILDHIDKQLQYEPTKKIKNRKPRLGLVGLHNYPTVARPTNVM